MRNLSSPDLGLGPAGAGARGRLPAWAAAVQKAFHPATLGGSARAALTALGLTLPLALLLARAGGVAWPWVVASSILGSAVVALLGGSPATLAGPGVATVAAVATLSVQYGPASLALACAGCGLLQLLAGLFRVGRFVHLVPFPVVSAFVVALGGWVVVQALPHVLGMAPSSVVDLGPVGVLDHLLAARSTASASALLVALLAGTTTLAGRRWLPRVPVGLFALALATAAVTVARVDVPRLPDLPFALPAFPRLALPATHPVQFAGAVLVLVLLASAETLLSLVAQSDRANAQSRRDPNWPRRSRPEDILRPAPDRELRAHGIANIMLAFVGGVPATGAIIRAHAVGRSGTGGRAMGLFHALLSLGGLVLLLATDQFVPIAAVAGIAIAHGLPLLSPAPGRAILRASRGQAAIFVVTAAVMLGGGLIAGIEAGLALSLLAVLLRVGRTRVTVHRAASGGAHQITFSGPITFLAQPRLDAFDQELAALDVASGVLLDLRDVPSMDMTGARKLVEITAGVVDRAGRLALLGAAPGARDLLLAVDDRGLIEPRLAITEAEVDQILDRRQSFELRAHVVASLDRFREEVRERYEPLFEKLAEDQKPHTLFIGCVDSRVTPAMLTGTHPGELFVIRCLGAIVVPPGSAAGGEAAAIEYAVGVLGVRNIVVCGHTRCGAIRAISSSQVPPGLDSLANWLVKAAPSAGDLTGAPDLDQAARNATVRQLANLRAFPQVRAGLEAGTLVLHGWFYDVGRGELYEWREAEQTFAVLRATDAAAT
jgi:carbonic anhydrase